MTLGTDNLGISSAALPALINILPANAPAIAFADFGSSAGLIMQGNASAANGRLRVTPAASSQVGSAWLEAKQPVQDGFETTFQFQISELYNNGADGFALVIQNNPTPMLGISGGALGYKATPNSLAVEFDTWGEGQIPANHLAIHSLGQNPNSDGPDGILTLTTNIPSLSDGAIHAVRIRYQPGNLSVFLDDLEVPALS